MDIKSLAKLGAKVRLEAIEREKATLHAAFPDIRENERMAKLRENAAKARAVLAAKRGNAVTNQT
jgi:hypothetical protein